MATPFPFEQVNDLPLAAKDGTFPKVVPWPEHACLYCKKTGGCSVTYGGGPWYGCKCVLCGMAWEVDV